MTDSFKVTKRLCFKIEEEEFNVLLPADIVDGKINLIGPSQEFCNFLSRKLNLLTSGISENLDSQTINIVSCTNKKISYMIRKKASLLGLPIELGEYFDKVRKEDVKRANMKFQYTSHQ